MQHKVQQFVTETEQITLSYKQIEDTSLKAQIIQQYQKSLHRIVNDVLELNDFNLVEKVLISASFNDQMGVFIVNNLLLDRLKLIQNSGSYRLLKKIMLFVKLK